MAFLKKCLPFLLGLIGPLIVWRFHLSVVTVTNYKDIMSATINMGAIGVGFLAAAITLMPSMEQNKFIRYLKQLGAYEKLLRYLISAIIILFLTSLISMLGLFLNTNTSHTTLALVFMMAWAYAFCLSMILTIRVISSFLKFLVVAQTN